MLTDRQTPRPSGAPSPSGRNRNHARAGMAMAAAMLICLSGCNRQSSGPPGTLNGQAPDGTVTMQQVQAAFIGSGGGGSGTLFFRGRSYPFTVGGLGIGGIGVSTIEADGEVYHLRDVAQFPGAYAQGRVGFAFGTTSRGDLWLQNETGVIMHLHARREGLMLSLGGDAVVISMNR